MSPRWDPVASCLTSDSPTPAGWYDPDSDQITASTLGPRVCEISGVSFKSEVSISHNPLWHLKVNNDGLQNQMFWRLTFLGQDLQAEEPNVGFKPITPEESLHSFNYPPIYGSFTPGVMVLTISWVILSYLSPYGFFFISFLLDSGLSHQQQLS